MKTIQINQENAVRAHAAADSKQKKLLEDLLGKEVFQPADIMDRIKTFEQVCAEMGKDSKDYEITSTDPDDIAANALRKMLLITRCFNGGVDADWSNSDQYKYYPWMQYSPGSGWSCNVFDLWDSHTPAGARLAFLKREHAEYCPKQFSEIYNNYFK